MRLQCPSIGFAAMLSMLAASPFLTGARANAQTEQVLYSFNNSVVIGTDGQNPEGGVTFDTAGNLYGTTTYGGSGACNLDEVIPGCGTVYELTPTSGGTWNEKILYSFPYDGEPGQNPLEPSGGNLVFDNAGNLYGITPIGGASADCDENDAHTYGCGTAFELIHKTAGWSVKVLHSFDNANTGLDGQYPSGTPVFDAAGNLYGAAEDGGSTGVDGMAFQLQSRTPPATWYERTMHSFLNNGKDARAPSGGLIFDASGNLYGLTSTGGKFGGGIAYELIPNATGWTEKILYSFGNGTDADSPTGSLIFDSSGNLYGTAGGGPKGGGTVFELIPGAGGTWTEKVIHSFDTGNDGAQPNGTLIRDSAGNLYGTTSNGGSSNWGAVFELSPGSGGTWTETILWNFANNGVDGVTPSSSLTFDSAGNLYGATKLGGTFDNGTVFEVTP